VCILVGWDLEVILGVESVDTDAHDDAESSGAEL